MGAIPDRDSTEGRGMFAFALGLMRLQVDLDAPWVRMEPDFGGVIPGNCLRADAGRKYDSYHKRP